MIEAGQALVLEGAEIASIDGELTAREAALVLRVVPKRAREVRAGRVLARRALARLGRPEAEILQADDRSPIWPDGISGSITHTDDYCAVVLGETRAVGHLGLDVEARDRLAPDLWPHVLVPEELARISSLATERERSDAATIVFSAKEAFYKAQHPRTGVILSFHDVTIRLVHGHGFDALLARDVAGLPGRVFSGRFALSAQAVWTLAVVPP